jgi:5-methyltetrahydrofolate--homocysteine methyltransferase
MPVDVLGVNCSTGPEHMRAALACLGETSSKPVSCLPNAGLPENVGGQALYTLAPDRFAAELGDLAERFGLSVVGGCCGTNPEHIRQLARRVAGIKAHPRSRWPLAQVSSGIAAVSLVQVPPPMLIGERLNAQGSKKTKELLLAEDYEGIAAVAREQLDGGAHTLDICVAMTERRDEAYLMSQVCRKLSQTVNAPLVIDTTEADVLEAALCATPGRLIVNAVNMENGRQRLDAMLPLIREHGAATIALTIDEAGMARTVDRKLEVARKIHDIATREYGLLPDALIFDALTFTLATGDPESANTAIETLEGIRQIKAALPGVLASLGVSNVSYGFKPAARAVLNSVFLYHAVQAGLDMAIVNPKQITPYAEIPEAERELAEDLLFNRRPDATARIISHFEGAKARAVAVDPAEALSPAERLPWRILHRRPVGVEADVDALISSDPDPDKAAVAVRALNQVLLPAMKDVGDKFAAGVLILPFVLQSAEVMRKAVSQLERYLDKAEGVSKGTVVLATVYGDVHDIGKNLVKTILSNNGYRVLDLGKQVPVSTIVDEAEKAHADVIGLSALLVATARQMPLVVRELSQRRLAIPVLIGGAAINSAFGRDTLFVENDVPYVGGVFYCRDAFEGLESIDCLVDPAARAALIEKNRQEAESQRLPGSDRYSPAVVTSKVTVRVEDVPAPPFWGSFKLGALPLPAVFDHLDEKSLFRLSWGARNRDGAEWEALSEEFTARLERMKQQAITETWLAPQALYGYFPAQSEGNDLLIFDPHERGRTLVRFKFPRRGGATPGCLADFFLPVGSPQPDVVALQVVTVGPAATARFDAMDAKDEYSEAYFFHGLAVQTAEATASFVFEHIRRELGLADARGRRYSWGYGALPDIEEHHRVFALLPAEKELGLSLTSAGQLVPEQSTAGIIVHHPGIGR